MNYLVKFKESFDFPFQSASKQVYTFQDTKMNNYTVNFDGEFDKIWVEGADDKAIPMKTGKTYDLEYVAKEKNFKKLTNAGNPFSVSNTVFAKILKDFLSKNNPDTISIEPTGAEEFIPRASDKDHTKYNLYLRTLEREFKNSYWKILKLEYNVSGESIKRIILVNSNSSFWKKNMKKFIEKLGDKLKV